MLGDINPQSVRIAQIAVVYPGRNHVTTLTIKRYDGRSYKPVDLDDLTRAVLVFPGTSPTIAFDSATDSVFTWAGNVLMIDLSDYAMPESIQPSHLIVFDAEHPQGQVLVDNLDSRLEFDFRLISTTGTLPPPEVGFITDAPQDGETYGRKDGEWVSLASVVSGVASFNGRSGVVTLTGGDVTTALGFTPVDSVALAPVATSGDYDDLTNKPFIPTTPGDLGAASAAQGALADTAVQPAELTSGLAGKVDVVPGKQLSDENYTAAEKAKLAGLESSRFKGLFASLGALETAFPTASAGDYADVDAGVGSDTIRYVWDVSDAEWQPSGSGAPITAADVKTLYESNPDTNAYTDAEKTKLGTVASNATANPDSDSLAESVSPTNKWFTVARVLAAVLTGLSVATGGAVVDTDTVLQAIGKLQKQITDLTTVVSGKQATLVSATNIKTVNGSSLLGSGNLTTPVGMTNPMTTAGDIIVGAASGVPARLAKGTDGQALKMVAGAQAWSTDLGDMLSQLTSSEVAVTGATTLTASAFGKMHVCTGTTSDYIVDLPAVSGNSGKIIGFRMSVALTKFVTLDANASELINGSTTRVMRNGESAILLCDGSSWSKIAGLTIPMFSQIQRAASQSIPDNTLTDVDFTAVVSDSAGTADISSDRITIKRPGNYQIRARSVFPDPGGSSTVGKTRQTRVYKNGAYLDNASPDYGQRIPVVNSVYPLLAADYIGANLYQNNGGAESVVNIDLFILEVPSW